MADGSITIDAILNSSDVEKGLKRLNSLISNNVTSTSSWMKSIGSGLQSLGSTISGVGTAISVGFTAPVTAAFTAASSKALDFIGTYESAMVIFKKKLGETGADEMYESLLNIAKGSRYAQEYIVSAGQTLVAMGNNAEDTAKYVQIATDAISGMGGSGAEVEAMAELFGNMAMQVNLYTDDLNQIVTAGIPVFDILAKKYNTTTSAIKEMASEGKITSEDFEYLTEVLLGNVEGMEEFSIAGTALEGKTGTLSGAIDSLNSSFRNFALDLLGCNINAGQTENYDKLINIVSKLGSTLENVGEKFSFVSDWFGKAIDIVSSVIDKFNDALNGASTETLETIAKVVLGLATGGPILLSLGQGINTVGSAFSGIGNVVGVISSFGSSVTSFVGNSNLFKSAITGMQNSLIDLPGIFGTAFTGIFGTLNGQGGAILSSVSKIFGVGGIVAIVIAGLGLVQSNFGDQISQIAQVAIQEGPEIITNLASGIVSALPTLIENGIQLIQTLVDVITANLPTIMQVGMQILMTLITSLMQNLPQINSMGIQLIQALIEGLIQCLPTLIEYLPTIISSIVSATITALPLIISAGVQILIALINGIIECIPTLVAMIPEIISNIVMALIENLPLIIEAGVNILIALITGLAQAIPDLIMMIPEIITNIVSTLWNNRQKIIEAGWDILKALIKGILETIVSLAEAAQSIGDTLKEKIGNLASDALQWGKDMLQGFIDGIKAKISGIVDAVKGIGETISSWLHFSRPDEGPLRDYESWMPDMVEGLTKTLKNASPKLYGATQEIAEKVADSFNLENLNDKLETAVRLETASVSASLAASAVSENSFNFTIKTEPTVVNMNTKKVAQVLTPEISKTIRQGGIRR